MANAGADVTICKGNSTTIGAPANGNNTYSWTSNIGGFTSAVSNPSVSPVVTTTYYLSVSNASFTTKDTVVVSVQNVTINLPDTLINLCIGNNTNIGPAVQPGYSYSWSAVPAGFISTLAKPNVSPVVNTTYYLTQKHTASSCQATAQVKVLVDSCIHGLISVFPNPAKDFLIIQLDVNNTEPKYFELIDAVGKLVLRQELKFRTTIDTRNIPQGIYFYTIRIEFGSKIKSGKIIIQH